MEVTLTVASEDGTVLFRGSKYPTDRECALSSFNSQAGLFDLPSGTYKIIVEATIGPGTFTVDEQTFIKNE